MSQPTITLEQIRQHGLEALAKELGPVGMIRFLQQFETGHGDYTHDRDQWLAGSNVQTFAEAIMQRRDQQP